MNPTRRIRDLFAPWPIVVGVAAGVISVTLAVALAALVFSGSLAPYRNSGIGLTLFGTAVVGMVTAIRGGLPGTMAGVQDNTAAILALAGATIVDDLDLAAAFPTVIALFAVTTGGLGLLLVGAGRLRLGRLVRFLPFPVVAGILAGTGVVIVVLAWDVVVGGAGLRDVFATPVDGGMMIRWIPGVVMAGALVAGTRGRVPMPAVLGVLVAGLASIYTYILVTGSSIADAQERGLLLGSFPSGPLWSPNRILDVADADWGAVAGQLGSVATVLILVPITLLLYVGAIELAVKADLDADRELRTAGVGNLVAALGGGLPGYHYVADTVIVGRLAPRRRTTAIVAALTVAAVVAGGGPLLGFLPTPFVGALLLFIGAAFVLDWTWDARNRLARGDMAVVLLILGVITFVGFLPGVAFGVGAALVLFVVRYSRLEVIRHHLDGTSYRSRVDREPQSWEHLGRVGARMLILELQSYLFFGTAERLRVRIEERVEHGGQPLRFLLLGFGHVTGIDSSAVMVLEKLGRMAEATGFQIVLTGVSPELERQLGPMTGSIAVGFAADLDRAVEACEEALLAEIAPLPSTGVMPLPVDDAMAEHFTEVILSSGDHLMVQGEPSRGLFVLREGRVTVEIDTQAGPVRLRSMGAGSLVGEVSLYLDAPCTATVRADTDVDALHLPPEAFVRLQQADPAAAAALNHLSARVLAQRLQAADHMIQGLIT